MRRPSDLEHESDKLLLPRPDRAEQLLVHHQAVHQGWLACNQPLHWRETRWLLPKMVHLHMEHQMTLQVQGSESRMLDRRHESGVLGQLLPGGVQWLSCKLLWQEQADLCLKGQLTT